MAVDLSETGISQMGAEWPGENLHAIHADVTSAPDIARAVAVAEDRFGRLDILCCCAAIAPSRRILKIEAEAWHRTMNVNAFGALVACQAAIPSMRRSGGGSIITWGSIASVVAEEEFGAYCASKAAVLMLTKVIAVEHASHKTRANCICPGMVDTPMAACFLPSGDKNRAAFLDEMKNWQPLGLGTPEQLANVALCLASDESSFMTGSTVMVDGGFTAL